MWESEPLYPCPVPIAATEAHDGGEALGPLYETTNAPITVDGDYFYVACSACCTRHGVTPGPQIVWPPRETP